VKQRNVKFTKLNESLKKKKFSILTGEQADNFCGWHAARGLQVVHH